MWKKIWTSLILIVFFSLGLTVYPKAEARLIDTTVHYIFNQSTYATGEEIKLTINLDKFAKLSEVKLRIKVDTKAMTPVRKEETYFQLTGASIFPTAILNDFVDQTYLRFHLIKAADISQGYYSGYKNNIGEITFIANGPIDSIEKYFQPENLDIASFGTSMYLFDTNDQMMPYQTQFSEKLQVEWNKEKYKIEVYAPVPNYLDDILIKNRKPSQYEIFTERTVDSSKIGTQVIQVAIVDKTNADYIILTKTIDITDTTPPIITAPASYQIVDIDLANFAFSTIANISDNYDQSLITSCHYFTEEGDELKNEPEFRKYLSSHIRGSILFDAQDSSHNVAISVITAIEIIDTTPPEIDEMTDMMIEDTKLANFNIENYIYFNDCYDRSPKLIFTFMNQNEEIIDDFLEELNQGKTVHVQYFVEDKSGNQSKTVTFSITIKDTIAPIIEEISTTIVKDTAVDQYVFQSNIKVTDNMDQTPILNWQYFRIDSMQDDAIISQKLLTLVEFLECLKKGEMCYILYIARDKAENISEELKQFITVIDTIPPEITIANIKEGNKYVELPQIYYKVTDNFKEKVSLVVTLNGNAYQDEAIKNVGTYEFYILATDEAGNQNEKTVTFQIIKNNVIGCGDDVECYLDNYFHIVIIVAVLFAMAIAIVVGKAIQKRRLRNKKQS